jgi:hypothetical protein
MRKRVAIRWGLAAGAAAAALAHAAYWYLPRERPGQPPSPEALELLADPAAAGAIWIAYPHQNLGRLERFVGDVAAWGALLAGRERGPSAALPRIGPFVAPPATELALALPAHEAGPVALARLYPSAALLARTAGRLARNPWLAGGAVEAGGAARTVAWDGSLWRLARPSSAGERPARPPAAEPGILALLRTGREVGPLPAGTYRLLRGDDGLELRLGRRLEQRPALPESSDPPAALLIERGGRRRLALVLVWEEEGVVPPFPAAAAIVRRGSPRPRLPGEDLLRLAGRKPKRRAAEGLEITALSERELERAAALLPALAGSAALAPNLRTAAVVDPAAALRIARRLTDGFEAFPLAALVGGDPARWAELLAPWERCGPMALAVARQGAAARAWLCPARARPAAPAGAPSR